MIRMIMMWIVLIMIDILFIWLLLQLGMVIMLITMGMDGLPDAATRFQWYRDADGGRSTNILKSSMYCL